MGAVYRFLRNTISFVAFLVYMLIYEDFKNYIKKAGRNSRKQTNSLAVLGNGPSLAKVLETWEQNEDITASDVAVVNFFCNDARFTQIQPEYYVLSDPMFYDPLCPLWEKGSKVFDALNEKVSWKMILYVQYKSLQLLDYRKVVKNPNITVVPFHTRLYSGYEKLRFPFYKRGLGSGNHGTVVLNAEFIGLNLGYKKIYMYGIDHTFFDGLTVTDENIVCVESGHFYESKKELKPLLNNYGHKTKNMTMTEFLFEKYFLFKGHEEMKRFAEYTGSTIFNCTQKSLVDVYSRKSKEQNI